jgi:hypothetical protein
MYLYISADSPLVKPGKSTLFARKGIFRAKIGSHGNLSMDFSPYMTFYRLTFCHSAHNIHMTGYQVKDVKL